MRITTLLKQHGELLKYVSQLFGSLSHFSSRFSFTIPFLDCPMADPAWPSAFQVSWHSVSRSSELQIIQDGFRLLLIKSSRSQGNHSADDRRRPNQTILSRFFAHSGPKAVYCARSSPP